MRVDPNLIQSQPARSAIKRAPPRASFGRVRAKTPTAAEVTWSQVHAFRMQRHHLVRRAPKKDLTRVVAAIGGAQAQLMSAAELQIAVRVDCSVADVRTALWR